MTNLYAPHGRILVKEIEQENKTSGGILLSANTTDVENKTRYGVVVVDAEVTVDNTTLKISKDTKLYFGKFAGAVVYFDGEKYISISYADIAAVEN